CARGNGYYEGDYGYSPTDYW
nr:immunoglobulin heavy chain junction region [Macaca mulatta]